MNSSAAHGLPAADLATAGPRSQALFARAVDVLPGGVSRNTAFLPPSPPYASHGSGYELVDEDGRALIDLQANYTTLVHGHCHPAIVEAATRAIGAGASFGLPTSAEVELAELLTDRIAAVERIRFTNSGTEAVMFAIQAARAYTGRSRILRFSGAYHGLYDAVLPDGAAAVPVTMRDAVATVPFDDAEAFRAAVEELGDELACVVLDLMPNRSGLRPASREFAGVVRAETASRGIVLIVDEVITLRLHDHGLQHEYGLTGDLVTLGKVIGGGLPIGAVGGRADIMQVFDPRDGARVSHSGTFAANPVSLGAGLACLRLLDGERIGEINRLGDRLRDGLSALGHDVAGRGSLVRVLAPSPEAFWSAAYRAGVLIANNGLMAVSTCMDDAVVDTVLERLACVSHA